MIEILGKIGFDWQVALANFVNFIIIFLILKKFAFGPIFKVIKERQSKINQGLEDAQKAETALLMSEKTSQENIEKAKLKANQIVGEAQTKGEKIISLSKNEALDLKADIIQEGEKQISIKKDSLKKEIQKETAVLVVNSLEKILKEKLTPEQENNYLNSILSN